MAFDIEEHSSSARVSPHARQQSTEPSYAEAARRLEAQYYQSPLLIREGWLVTRTLPLVAVDGEATGSREVSGRVCVRSLTATDQGGEESATHRTAWRQRAHRSDGTIAATTCPCSLEGSWLV